MNIHIDDMPEYALRNCADWNRRQAANMRQQLKSPHAFVRKEAERRIMRYEENAYNLEYMCDY